MKHKLIVFDWNGTVLADTVASWQAANICLEFYGAPAITLQRYRETFHFPVIHFYHLNGLTTDEILARQDEGNALFQESYERLAAHTRTRSGARPLLDWITENGMSCIILSNYQTQRIQKQLERLNIAHYFQHVDAHNCNGATILHSTTKAERLDVYMKKHGYRPEDTFIIGDSAEEPDIARQLGLTSIGITDGCLTRKRLREAKPDYIVNRLEKIKTLGLITS